MSIFFQGPELLSKYIGVSEESVRNVFERYKEFFRSFEAIFNLVIYTFSIEIFKDLIIFCYILKSSSRQAVRFILRRIRQSRA